MIHQDTPGDEGHTADQLGSYARTNLEPMNNQTTAPIPSKDENPKGLHAKYRIQKFSHYKEKPSQFGFSDKLTPVFKDVDPGSEYFVLRLDTNGDDPNHIAACREAIHTYAAHIQDTIPQLAADLRKRYPLLKTADEVIPALSSDPTEQTAEYLLKEAKDNVAKAHGYQLFQRETGGWTRYDKMFDESSNSRKKLVDEVAVEYLRLTLEAASKELPEVTQEYAKRGVSYERQVAVFGRRAAGNAWALYMNGAAEYRAKAAPIIASLKQDVSHNANRAIEIAAERDGAIAKIKELEATNAQLREKEIRGDRKIAQLEHEVVVLRSRIREMEATDNRFFKLREEALELLAYLRIHSGIEEVEGEQIISRLREATNIDTTPPTNQ